MKTPNLAQRNKDKTNFLPVYRDGLSHSVEAVFHAEQVCEQQQMASSEGAVYSTVLTVCSTNAVVMLSTQKHGEIFG